MAYIKALFTKEERKKRGERKGGGGKHTSSEFHVMCTKLASL